MADEWAAFNPEPAAGAVAPSGDPWAAFKPEGEPAQAEPQGDTFADRFDGEKPVPESFIKRLILGRSVDEKMKMALQDVNALKEGFGSEPLGWSNEHVKELMDYGVLHDPARGTPGPLRLLADSLTYGVPKVLDAAMRGVNAGIHFGASVASHIHEDETQATKLKNELTNFGNYLMVNSMASFGRPHPSGAGDQVVGTLPREADFKTSAEVLTPPNASPKTFNEHAALVEQRLREMWEEKGIHPAEAVHDAASDSFLRHDLTAPMPESIRAAAVKVDGQIFTGVIHSDAFESASKALGRDVENHGEGGFVTSAGRYVGRKEALEIATKANQKVEPKALTGEAASELSAEQIALDPDGGIAHSLGAAASEPTTLPPVTPITAAEPAPLAGRIAAAAKETADNLFDMGRDIQMKLAPMATGTNESMAIAKDFANTMRRNRWEWSRIDEDIAKRFTPEQRKRMWDAADEESVARQLGESREHQGLVTLEPAERAAVEDLHTRAQNAWVRARDLGMVEGEGLPAYTPRMVINAGEAVGGEGGIALNGLGMNLKTRTGNMKQRKNMTAEETEAAMKRAMGDTAEIARDIRALPLATAKLEDAIAGRTLIEKIKEHGKATGDETVAEGSIPTGSEHKWFTMDHPAFKTWRPKFKEKEGGGIEAVKDAEGNPIFEQTPIYIRDDFEGPLRAVLTQRSGATYSEMMSLKGKTMSLVMNSPMIHNLVEFGRALPAFNGNPYRLVKAYFDGNRAKNDFAVMSEAIDNGLVPIGKRFFNQDITSIMEAPDLTPGRSMTSKILSAVPGLFDHGAEVAVKRSIDKAGDFWHNTLLWDRIADLQMGLYVNLRGDLLRKGVDAQTSSRMAAHFANRYAGALPQEAMSAAATKVSNFLLFSRSFTMGNLGVMKDILTGLPKDVLAQIERDMGVIDPAAKGYAKSLARRKAFAVVALDIGLMYVGNSVLQSSLNVMLGDTTIDEESHGYARRAKEVLNEATTHPLSLLQPFDLAEKLSATGDNEPGKRDRLKIGYSADGTAIYARNPVGKIGEEFIGFMSSPLDMLKKKEGTIARPMLQVLSNDKGFGRKIYDAHAETPADKAWAILAIIEHIAKAQTPEGQINAVSDLVKGDGSPGLNLGRALAPIGGVTISGGAPGGPAVGEMYAERGRHQFQVDMAMPDIRKQIARGDTAGAQQAMTALGIAPGLQRFYIRTSLNPSTRLSTKALGDFYRTATPAQRERMERIRSPQPQASPLAE